MTQLPMQYSRREAFEMIAGLPLSLAQGVRSNFIPYKQTGNDEFVVTADSGRYIAELVTARELMGRPLATVKEAAEKTRAYACFNGGFFGNDGSPSGLFMRKGKIVKPFKNGKGDGVLYIDREGQINLGFRDEFERSRNVVDAVQLMLLRRSGSPLYTYNEKYQLFRANLLGLSAQHDFTGMIFDSTNYTLGDLHMVKDHRCIDVAMLDSGPSASVWSNSRGLGDNPDVANFLVIYKL